MTKDEAKGRLETEFREKQGTGDVSKLGRG